MEGSRIEPAASQEPSLLDRMGRVPLVGRQRELAEAVVELRHALASEGRVLLISGEPGVGKTRLAREIVAQMQGAGGTALVGECYAEGDPPYAPISRLIREGFAQAPALDLAEAVLADLLDLAPPLRARYPAISARRSLDPASEQQRLFESVATWCDALCSRAPLLLLIDDAQWADGATLFLLRHLARRGRGLPLLLLMTLREAEAEGPSSLANLLVELNRERLATHLRLGRLGRTETGDLLGAIFTAEMAPELLDSVYAQTEGNPFFVEETCKALIEEGKLVYRDQRWHRASMTGIKLPQTVRSAILARVARIPQPAQEMLRLAAILGREFDFETLQLAGELDEETLIGAFESALRAQLISEVLPGGPTTLRFSFAHVLISTALRESTVHVRRRLLHRRVADVLERLHPDDFAALAYHYAEAGDPERAHKYFAQAGIRAQTWAPEDAVRLFRAALERWPDTDMPGRAETLGRLGYCLWVTADLEGALECFVAAYELFDQLGLRLQCSEVQRMIGRIYWAQADRAAALAHYQQALEILEQGPDTVELARAISSISQMHMLAPEPDAAIAWGERALATAKRVGAEDVIVHALNNIGSSYCQSGNTWEQGMELLQASLQRALALKSPADACRGYYNIAVALQRRCRHAAAGDWLEQLRAYAVKAYMHNYANLAVWRLMWVNWDMGHWRAALALREQLAEFSGGLYATWAGRVLASIDMDVGRIEAARQELERGLPAALKANDLQTTVPHLGQLIRVYSVTGRAAEAGEAVKSLLESVARRPYPLAECVMPLLFACQWLGGQGASDISEPGQGPGEACLAHLERLHGALQTEESRAVLTEARACLLQAVGRPDAAAEHLREAAAGWAALGRRYDHARVLGSLRSALTAAGDTAGARAAGEQALHISEALAAELDAELRASFLASPLVQQLRQAADAPAPAAEPAIAGRPPAGLTEREIEVLRLVAQGLTNGQIAEKLVVSPLTVNAHLRSIFNKLDVTRRAAAARIAAEHGLV